MSTKIKRTVLDFCATDYTKKNRSVKILDSIPKSHDPSTDGDQRKDPNQFIQRWYLSLQGEDSPHISRPEVNPDAPLVYRYDWAFGITLLGGHYWNWQQELPEESALALHLILEPKGENAPEAIPASATLNALRPSKNTKTVWEAALPVAPKAGAAMADLGSAAYPMLKYLSTGLLAGANVLESYTGNQKNWYLYQFFDEKHCCPVVEWKINKRVLKEYGPLLRGTLFLSFHGGGSPGGSLRIKLRPQIRYCSSGDLDFIVPTDKLSDDNQVFIDVKPGEATSS